MYAEEHIQVYRIEARSLLIEWVTDSRYWTWTWDSGYVINKNHSNSFSVFICVYISTKSQQWLCLLPIWYNLFENL